MPASRAEPRGRRSGRYSCRLVHFRQGAQGLFYARSLDGGEHFTAPTPIGDPARRPARPYLLTSGHTVRLVWKEFDGEVTAIKQMTSTDDGASWSAPVELATTADASDHPLLVSSGTHSFLSWMTRAEGYRLLPLDDVQ